MAKLEWKQEYSTGIASVDNEHKKLIEQTFKTYWPDEKEITELMPKMIRQSAPNFAAPKAGRNSP